MIFEVNVVGFFCIRDWFTAATIFREMVVTLTLANVEQSEKLYLCNESQKSYTTMCKLIETPPPQQKKNKKKTAKKSVYSSCL